MATFEYNALTSVGRRDGTRAAAPAKADLDELEAILKDKGHTTMLADGQRPVHEGVTTEDELNKICGIVSERV